MASELHPEHLAAARFIRDGRRPSRPTVRQYRTTGAQRSVRDLPNVDAPEPVAGDEYQPLDDGMTATPNDG